MHHVLLIIAVLFLNACAAQLPTSERLEMIRMQKQAALSQEMTTDGLEFGSPVFLRVFKEEAILESWVQDPETGRYIPFKSYPICNYSGELGPKIAEGDYQSPEGFYTVGARQMNPWSSYHLSFNIGFPNEYDRTYRRTGSNLMIHGDCKSEGCYALTDPAIEEVYLLVEASIANGKSVPVHIFPFRMTPKNTLLHANNKWSPFWQNLQEGYNAFERTKIPPHVDVQNGRYMVRLRNNTQNTLF